MQQLSWAKPGNPVSETENIYDEQCPTACHEFDDLEYFNKDTDWELLILLNILS